MIKYCKYCREMHDENELCERYKSELKKHPEWLADMAQFVKIAGEAAIIQSQNISGKKKTVGGRIVDAKRSGKIELAETIMDGKDSYEFAKQSIVKSTDVIREQALSGAMAGVTMSVTISAVISFIRYKDGEITKEEAYTEIGQESINGMLSGAMMGATNVFLAPLSGVAALSGGMLVSVYLAKATENLLDEVFGKGVYEEILHAAGFVHASAKNIADMMNELKEHAVETERCQAKTVTRIKSARSKQGVLDKEMQDLDDLLEGL